MLSSEAFTSGNLS